MVYCLDVSKVAELVCEAVGEKAVEKAEKLVNEMVWSLGYF
jgi:hypothetical protein